MNSPMEDIPHSTTSRRGSPLLEVRDGQVRRGERKTNVPHLVVQGPQAAFLDDASSILQLLREPSGLNAVQVLGAPASESLQSGMLSYAPRLLPAPQTTKLLTALELSARLIGLGSREARDALQRVGLHRCEKKLLAELAPREHRKAGLAHALMGRPQFVVLEDPFDELSDEDSAEQKQLIETELAEVPWLLGVRLDNPSGLSLALTANQFVVEDQGHFRTLRSLFELSQPSYWIRSLDPLSALARDLRADGAEVVQSPNPHVLLIHGKSPQDIFAAATRLSLAIHELSPLERAGNTRNHAKSSG